MPHPFVYEINTRCWLREISARRGTAVTLADVPETEFAQWQKFGFTHLWLMGVWPTGPKSREVCRRHAGVRKEMESVLPDLNDSDMAGSPYAVGEYRVAEQLGGERALGVFRRRLADHGLKLLLDFVPNHTGLDFRWLRERPELYVRSDQQREGTFRVESAAGAIWLAHGKDPYFPGWTDTVQLNYRNPATRAAMRAELKSIAQQCDGVRCDMAMLELNEIFRRTWAEFPREHAETDAEFWTEAIAAVKQEKPEFLFLAEVYWNLEARLQSLGFDFTYDKALYDILIARHSQEAQRHLLETNPSFIRHSAHFLENHDEPRIASRLSWPEHRAAALLVLGLPGMRFLHDGQLDGAAIKVPVQLSRRPAEIVQPEIRAHYESLLAAIKTTAVGRGEAVVLKPLPAWEGNPSSQNFVLVQWQSEPGAFDLVVVNLAPHQGQCRAPLSIPDLQQHQWRMRDLLGNERYERDGAYMAVQGLFLDLPAHGAQLFHFESQQG